MDEMNEEELISKLRDFIANLPPDEQSEALENIIGGVIKLIPNERLVELSAELNEHFSDELPIARATQLMIEGQLALREIGGDMRWR